MSERLAMLIGELSLAVMMAGVATLFYYRGRPITIDRIRRTISGPRRVKYGFTGDDISTHQVASVQSCCDAPPGSDPKTDTVGYELNLILKDPPSRLHLITDTSGERVRKSSEALAEFLCVSHWDCTGPGD